MDSFLVIKLELLKKFAGKVVQDVNWRIFIRSAGSYTFFGNQFRPRV